MKKQFLTITALLFAFLLLCACGEEEAAPEETADQSVAVEITRVERGSISAESTVSGEVAAGEQKSVYVGLSALCTEVYVEVDDTVSEGQTLCMVDLSSLWANYDTASMNYKNAQQNYNDQAALLQKQVDMAAKNLSDTKALLEVGGASQMEVDNAQLAYENAVASKTSALNQLEVGIKSAKDSMDQITNSLAGVDKSGKITSPVSGTVLACNIAQNSFTSPGVPVVTIEENSSVELTVNVSETLLPKLKVGNTVGVEISSLGREFEAKIKEINKSANPATHLYGVTIGVPSGSSSGLRSGIFADVTFYTDTQNNVVVVPTEAIQTGTEGQYVYTLDSGNIAHQVKVETGLVGDGVTEVTSGLEGGEALVTVGQFYLSEGAAARVVAPEV